MNGKDRPWIEDGPWKIGESPEICCMGFNPNRGLRIENQSHTVHKISSLQEKNQERE